MGEGLVRGKVLGRRERGDKLKRERGDKQVGSFRCSSRQQFWPGRHPVSKRQPRDEGHCGRGGKISDTK